MSARDKAIEAMRAGHREARDCEWFGEDEVLPHTLDAIPPSVQAQLALERGGLQRVEGYHDVLCPLFIWEHDPDIFDDKPGSCGCEPVYRLAGVTK